MSLVYAECLRRFEFFAMLPGTGGFKRAVERQQVGLEGEFQVQWSLLGCGKMLRIALIKVGKAAFT